MVVVHRSAAPPLRFMGREVCGVADAGLWIRIWQVRSAGFVLAHGVEDGQRADRHPTAESAMAALEAYCARIEGLDDLPETPRRLHLSDLLEEAARLSQWRRRFRALAGEALDRFDAWERQEAQGGVR
jgi:hypothetical protein